MCDPVGKQCDEKLRGEKESEYRGCQTKTRSGFTCQKWTTKYPHKHTRTQEDYPNKGLGDHNKCRNPDGETGIWCYTTNPNKRWELCDPINCNCDIKSTDELNQFMKDDLKELEQILKNNNFNDNDSKNRVGTILLTMIDTSKGSSGLNIMFIPCFFGFNSRKENRSIIKLILEDKTYYIIELYTQTEKGKYKKTIEKIDYSELPINWYHTFSNNNKRIKALENTLHSKINTHETDITKCEKDIKTNEDIIKKIQENETFKQMVEKEKEIKDDYDSLKETLEKDFYKHTKVMRFKKYKGKKIPAFLYPELFICDPPTTKQESSSNYHNCLSNYDKKVGAAKETLKETRAKELDRSSVYVTYKNIVERQVEQLRAENNIEVEKKMNSITGKEKKLKENDFTIKYSGSNNTKTYYEFKTKIKESKNEIDKFDEENIKKNEISCSEKARYKNIITILKKSTLKLSKYVNKASIAISVEQPGSNEIYMNKPENFIQSKSKNTIKNEYFRTTPHDDKPVTTQSTTQNYITLKKQPEDSYINTVKDSYI